MPVFRNPVLPGCHPDPSICRAGEDYYLVTSSFGYFPGIPVHHSRDLATWELVGHVFDAQSQLPLAGLDLNDGVWASTIRYHRGLFYVVSTIANARRGAATLLSTAIDPAGPWSQPVELEADGIDPSLFFDEDGRCWFTAARDAAEPAVTGPAEIWMRELDLVSLRLVGPEHLLWHGAVRGQWVEGPHIFRRRDRYILLGAEGGTERNHAVTAATATAVTGPFVTDPRSPLLSHRHLGADYPVQNVGHADLVDTPDGQTWAVVLGVRPINQTHTLGRETFLVPVAWTDAGPVFAPGSGVLPTGGATLEPASTDVGDTPADAEQESAVHERLDPRAPLALQGWSSLRGPVSHLIEPSASELALVITPSTESLCGRGTPAFVARRQQHVRFTFTCRVRPVGLSGAEEAGVAIFQHQDRYVTVGISGDERGGAVVRAVLRTGAEVTPLGSQPVDAAAVTLRVEGDEVAYTLWAASAGQEKPSLVARIDRATLSTERAGGFVGVHLGVFAQGALGATPARVTVGDVVYEGRPVGPVLATSAEAAVAGIA